MLMLIQAHDEGSLARQRYVMELHVVSKAKELKLLHILHENRMIHLLDDVGMVEFSPQCLMLDKLNSVMSLHLSVSPQRKPRSLPSAIFVSWHASYCRITG